VAETGELPNRLKTGSCRIANGTEEGLQFFWAQRRAIFVNEEFVSFVDEMIEQEGDHSQGLYSSSKGDEDDDVPVDQLEDIGGEDVQPAK